MKKYIIERQLPGAGRFSMAELRSIAQKSCEVLDELEAPYHWIETYVTDNKLYCVHIAPDRETVLEHARRGGFPVDSIAEVRYIMDPTTSAIKVVT
ncbi:MAG TPA: DUF4242 domain-containing protein [Chryseolinea sp.]|nr:DUF4242 domain-containing protein [Chryseolinea sp.]